ncbi:CHASE2 domain-containing protein (plasmid) [Kovacikia minuta CCNUW1]|uniref:CHASE2 domain-containing protein n=1 Tax=Kovacikia minuta TaxID=2931930 RepID=UPI001CCF0C4C|nr:CHASE2 domain-containing protein [Kovacikia minuta]UBF30423.1 CHASE2 domain-containing protein [Kovacikia minuta CCNUW1]
MRQPVWQILKSEFAVWRMALPGFIVIVGVILLRWAGALQFLELVALDRLLQLRPAEPMDERITIIGITEADIQRIKTYPIPDGEIADLIRRLQTYQPAVIGLDIVRDIPVEPGHAALETVFRTSRNVIGSEIALDPSGITVEPPPALPDAQVGFADTVSDLDGYQRRSLLGAHNAAQEHRFSLSLRLAEQYLRTRGFELDNGIRDPDAMRFGKTELTRFQPNSGGYMNADAGGNQILLNVRSGKTPFRVLSPEQIRTGNPKPEWLRERIVLIGMMSLSVKDVASSGAITSKNPGRVYGVEFHAHAVSQMVSAVLDGRPLLQVWGDGWEYLWIAAWGLLGLGFGRIFRSPWKILFGMGLASFTLIGVCYGLILLGWWVPLVPALLVLVLNGAGLSMALFYRYHQENQLRLEERQLVIQRLSETLHSGPSQLLDHMLRVLKAEPTVLSVVAELQRLDESIDAIVESLQREAFHEAVHSSSENLELWFQKPLHELLYKTYDDTLQRDLPHLKPIKFKIVQFDPLDTRHLKVEQIRSLCRFLEEALCNVGKYAVGATRLTTICTQEKDWQVIRITDNGIGLADSFGKPKDNTQIEKQQIRNLLRSLLKFPQFKIQNSNAEMGYSGLGTKLSQNLARQLGGTFRRYPNQPKGTVCELKWRARKNG